VKWFFKWLALSCSLWAESTTTTHTLLLEKGPLSYNAIVSSLPLRDANGHVKAEMGFTAYIKEGPLNHRPITFAFNGGPGSSSIWLHAGAFGPRRVVTHEEGQSVTPPYCMIDNLETLLDLTDLVFIDPVGTGLSRASEEDAGYFYNLGTDIQSFGAFIRDYLTAHNRWNSPKYLAGESYGALRACGVADHLQNDYSIYLNGLILISPAIDYQTFVFHTDNQLPHFLYLPTFAATAWHYGRLLPLATLEEVVSKARRFAYETYAPSMLKSFSPSPCEKEVLFNRLADFTGLSLNTIKWNKGRISDQIFQVEFFSEEHKAIGRFDTRCSGNYSDPNQIGFVQDPSDTAISGIFIGAFHDYLQNELQHPASYCPFSLDVNSRWDYSGCNSFGYPNLMGALRQALAVNPSLKIFAGCGYFDCATPFAATEYCLDHLDLADADRSRCQVEYYEGGHMFYLSPPARIKFKHDLIRFYEK